MTFVSDTVLTAEALNAAFAEKADAAAMAAALAEKADAAATTAALAEKADAAALAGKADASTTDTANNALPKSGGTMTGPLVLDGAPAADLHAATKKYADEETAKTTRLSKTSAYTAVKADKGALIDCTGTWTLSLTTAATLGAGWWCYLRNSSNGVITLTPSGGQTVDGAATVAIPPGNMTLLLCNGSDFSTASLFRQEYTTSLFLSSDYSFVVPKDVFRIRGYAYGKGGNSVSANSTSLPSGAAAAYAKSTGGGGGGHAFGDIPVKPGDTVAVTFVAGTAKVSVNGVDMLVGNPGANGNAVQGQVAGATPSPANAPGGTATIHASVLNGAAYSGTAGTTSTGGGCVLPTGAAITSGSALCPTARPVSQAFTDPLLRGATGPGGKIYVYTNTAQEVSLPVNGGGGASSGYSYSPGCTAQNGASFGAGGNASQSTPTTSQNNAYAVGGDGGFLAPGGKGYAGISLYSGSGGSYSATGAAGAGGPGCGAGPAEASSFHNGTGTTVQASTSGAAGGLAGAVIFY